MTEVLVTGGTGLLGSALVPALRAAGHSVRVLSRRPGDGHTVGDLTTGAGVAEAVAGVELVLHAASRVARGDPAATDVAGTRRLAVACREAGVRHLLFVSIVGVDRLPYTYYRAKFAAEQVIAAAGVPYTTVRVAQFHPLVASLLRTLRRRTPVLPLPAGWRIEPVAVRDVAAHLAARVGQPPAAGIEEFGGPETLDVADAARTWLEVTGQRGYVVPAPVPGGFGRAFRSGLNLVGPTAPRGALTWREWLRSPAAATERYQRS
jgi:uncharacterized protein YbjT (DUF2867 family)